jgi:hypothetical protein
LCAYCRAPSKGFLYKDGDKIFGACSPEHLKKIVNGERLKNIAQLNEQGLAYAISTNGRKVTGRIYLERLSEPI